MLCFIKMASYLESAFEFWLREHPKIPPCVREHKFALPRQWRFDFAWPDHMFAVEIEGMGRADGGQAAHRTREGFLKDAEKYERAMILGWRVYRVPGPWVATRSRLIWRPEVMKAVTVMLTAPSRSAKIETCPPGNQAT